MVGRSVDGKLERPVFILSSVGNELYMLNLWVLC